MNINNSLKQTFTHSIPKGRFKDKSQSESQIAQICLFLTAFLLEQKPCN